MRIAILGLGLIGGSIARSVVPRGWPVTAWTPSGTGPRAATADGVTMAPTLADAVRGAELVVVAAPPLAALELLDALGSLGDDELGRETVVTDVASTKAAIVERARAAGLRFVGGHPLAGRETSGYAAADGELFQGRPWVVVPTAPPDVAAEERVTELVRACGAEPVRMGAADHDAAVAAISHLPLLVSAALVEAVTGDASWSDAERLAAGGWASMTRLARSNVAMGAGILATNAAEVSTRLAALSAVLAGWSTDLASRDVARRATDRLERAREALDGRGPDSERDQ